MSKYLVTKKVFEENNNGSLPSSKFIIGKRFADITDFVNPNFSSIKKHFETKFQLNFDTNGGNTFESKEVILGKPYGELPIPTKAQNIFIGWFTKASGGIQITSESIVSLDINTLYARWEYVQIDSSNCTSYSVTTNSSYRNTGIYTASIANSSQPIYIDWGDGTVEKTNSSISQKSHTYKTNGNFTVKISDNITSFAPSGNNSTWYGTTSQNRYTFKGMLTTGSKVTSLPTYAFYYCSAMTNIDFMQTCWPTVTSLPNYCFCYCTGLTSIQGAKRFTNLGAYCFQYCSGLTGTQDLSGFKFTTLPNSYTFANCTNVTQWILPNGFTGTSFGNYMFSNDTKLSSLVLPNSLTSTGTYAFQNCSNLNNITIPSKVQSIEYHTFYGCTSLNNVNIEATNLTAINHYAFYNCNKLADLDLPDTVNTIGNYAFYGCTSLNYAGRKVEIEIPDEPVVPDEPAVPDEPENNLNKPLTFTSTGNSIISFGKTFGLGSSNYAPPEFNYSVDGGETWQYYEYDTEINITQTQSVMFRAVDNGNETISEYDTMFHYQFSMYGDGVNASGNIMTLLDKTGEKTTIDVQGCFNMLFAECNILLTAPTLPATTLAQSCYSYMFYYCSSLTQVSFPNLEKETVATEVVENQYAFYDAAFNIEAACKDGILIINSTTA